MTRLWTAVLIVLASCAQVPREPDAAPVTWSGVVLAPDGSPAGGARVRVIRDYDEDPIVIGETLAGPDGRFAVRLPPFGSAAISAVLPGVGAGRVERLDAAQDLTGIGVRTRSVDTVRGVVVDEVGEPVSGAAVAVSCGALDATVTRTVSAADGTFAVPDQPLCDLVIEVRHPGFAIGGAAAVPGARPSRIVLERGGTLEGIVLTSDGRHPVPGAIISVAGRSATSDVEGRFRVPGVPRDRELRLLVHAPGLGMAELRELLWAPDAVLRVRLWPAIRLEGRVVHAESGHGVAGIEVGASIERCTGFTIYGLSQGETVRTGPDGRFVFAGFVPEGDYGVRSPDWQTLWSADRRRDNVISVVPRVSLDGSVLDPDGQPVAGARVGCRDARAGDVVTDRDGRFTLRNVADRFPFNRLLARKDDRLGFADVKGRPEDVVIPLAPRGRLEGRVVDPAGRPVGGARVSAIGHIARSDSDTFYTRETWTRRDGTFRIVDVDEGERYRVSVHHPDFETVEFPRMPDALIVLRPPSFVTVRVVSESGTPIAGASIGEDGKSGADGRIALRVDSGDRVRGSVRAPGYQEELLGDWTRQEDGTHLVTLRPGHRIEGSVLDLHGRPLPAVRIIARLVGSYETDWGKSDIAGRFWLDGLPEGEHTIIAFRSGRIFDPDVTAPTGASDVVVREIEGVVVAGQVVGEAGKGVLACVVAVPVESDTDDHLAVGLPLHGADGAQFAHSDDDGRFRITRLLGSEFVLHVHAEDHDEHVALPVPGIRAGEAKAKIVVRRALRITGRVTGPDGSPRTGFLVRARPARGGLPMREVGAADDGRFEIPALYPTTYSLEVRTHGNKERARVADVAAGTEGLTIVVGE